MVGPAALLFCLLISGNALADITLCNGGRTEYRIVVPADAIPSERYAAEELQHYLEKLSGAKPAIVTDAEKPVAREILLGDNAHLSRLSVKPDFSNLGPDGFELKVAGKSLIIAGGKPRGTLNGVYTLLEEKFGVRWFTPELESVPRLKRASLPELDETHIPSLQYREVYWRETMRDADFAARLRLNGQHYKLIAKHGGPAARYFPFVHSFDALIPPELFKEHPEYFPLINGQRKSGYVQRCLSNPEVLKIAIAQVRQWIHDHPEATIFSVSQNDTINNCQCSECKAIDDAEGSPAGSLLKFVNAVAEAIEPEAPNVRIDTLAYQYTRKPPKTIRPRRNVIVRLCSIECCFGHPLESCPSEANRRFRSDLLAWEPVAPHLDIWDYTTDFAHYLQPFPNLDSLQANVRFFANHGVTSLFEEGNYSSGGNGEMAPLRAYVLSKLLWNPNADVDKLIQEFVTAYYGKAATKILAYIETIHRPVREKGMHCRLYDGPRAAYLSAEVMDAAEAILNEAEGLAENDEIRLRVQTARLPVWYVKLANQRATADARMDLLRLFMVVARKGGITEISESGPLSAWVKGQGLE
jgi:hypothetical protein